jgi:hypothetical protein
VVADVLDLRLVAGGPHDLVGLLAARRHARVGEVGQLELQVAQPALDLLDLPLELADLVAQLRGRGLELGRVLARLLALPDLAAQALALAALVVDRSASRRRSSSASRIGCRLTSSTRLRSASATPSGSRRIRSRSSIDQRP